jgi:pimeloyl-ACP methyl ester carboxylesterase
MLANKADYNHERSIPLAWGKLSYTESGGGRPIILLHELGRDRRDWQPLLPWLEGRRLICLDLRGHGGSDIPKKSFGMKALASDVIALGEDLWLGQFDLVGHGLGGLAAAAAVEKNPAQVGKIALLDAFLSPQFATALSGDQYEDLSREESDSLKEMRHKYLVRWAASIREDLQIHQQRFDGAGALEKISHKILALYGDRNRPRPDRSALGIPYNLNIKLDWLPGTGHHFPLTNPNQTGKVLREFFIGDSGGGKAPDKLPPVTLADLAIKAREFNSDPFRRGGAL